MSDHIKQSINQTALFSILCVYTIWGIQPLYWQFFKAIPLSHILAHRIIWSAVFLVPAIFVTKRHHLLLEVFRSFKQIQMTALCALSIGFNWLVNIYAAATKQVVEASLGHYITPILIILLGVLVFHETLELYKLIAVFIAFSGVVILTIHVGKLPLIALLLILTFVTYTFLKKVTPMDPIVGITAETLLLLPLAIGYLVFKQMAGLPFFITATGENTMLLISTGVFTSVPLLLFSVGVRGLDLSNVGFIQYYAPSLSLVIGIFVFKETFTTIHFLSFGLLWLAILIVLIAPFLQKSSTEVTIEQRKSS